MPITKMPSEFPDDRDLSGSMPPRSLERSFRPLCMYVCSSVSEGSEVSLHGTNVVSGHQQSLLGFAIINGMQSFLEN